jgi:hypothetical protein
MMLMKQHVSQFSHLKCKIQIFLLDKKKQQIIDETKTNVGQFRENVLSIIKTSFKASECGQRLSKMILRPKQKISFEIFN